MGTRIQLIQDPSLAQETIEKVRGCYSYSRVPGSMDTNHSHDHALAEIQAYAPPTI
jgi:cephalosporin hydroxylase